MSSSHQIYSIHISRCMSLTETAEEKQKQKPKPMPWEEEEKGSILFIIPPRQTLSLGIGVNGHGARPLQM